MDFTNVRMSIRPAAARFLASAGVGLIAVGATVAHGPGGSFANAVDDRPDRVDRGPIERPSSPILGPDPCSLEWTTSGPGGETTVTETGMPMDPFEVSIATGVSSMGAGEDDTQTEAIYGAGIRLRPLVEYTISFTWNLSTWDSYSDADGFWDVFFVHANSEGFYWDLVTGDPVADLACSTNFAMTGPGPLTGPLWTFGGVDWGDGVICTSSGSFSFTYMESDASRTVFLSVGLDTGVSGSIDGQYPSWGTFTVEVTGHDCPDDPDLGTWNAPGAPVATQRRNNCYNYATNRQTNSFAQPGVAAGMPLTAVTCAAVTAAAEADGLCSVASPDDCDGDYCVIALVVAPGPPVNPFADYHWYRLNDDGTWSHKPGETPARTTDSAGVVITSPETADRSFRFASGTTPGYTRFCGYFCVPGDATLIPTPPLPASPAGPGLTVTVAAAAGLPSSSWMITDEDVIAEIIALIDAGDPTGPPPPLEPLGFAGFLLEGPAVPGLPEFVRVFEGVIEVIDEGSVEYRTADPALEILLVDGAIENDAGAVLTFCIGDLDDDGLVGVNDLLLVLTEWGATDPGNPADIDGDELVGVGDLVTVLGRWGPCD